ncbi:hypothetical protein BH11CYA1_BH11CYA1_27220 [soil metagenome]
MISYILPEIDASQRKLLGESGVLFSEWGTGIFLEETQFEFALEILDAIVVEEKPGEFEDNKIVSVKYGRNSAKRGNKAAAKAKKASEPKKTGDSRIDKARQAYIKAANWKLTEALDQARAALKVRMDALPPVQEKFFQATRQQFLLANASPEQVALRYKSEYERLCAIPQVKAVRSVPGAILVYTDLLTATHVEDGSRHMIGEFLIKIRINDGKTPLQIGNRTRVVDGKYKKMHAPYIDAHGKPLLGDMQETWVELVAQFELATTVELIIQFIETVNDDDVGSFIDCWPSSAAA